MPDAFFQSNKNRKRKRSAAGEDGPSTSKRPARAGASGKSQGRGGKKGGVAPPKRSARDEELSDETRGEDGGTDIDDMDLRAPDVDPNAYESAEEDEDETPAEKRLRLAKLYLEGVKEGLGLGVYLHCIPHDRPIEFFAAEGEFDAAEIDRELISARLKQDVLEPAGKVHLFVADTVRAVHSSCSIAPTHFAHSTTCQTLQPSARGDIASPQPLPLRPRTHVGSIPPARMAASSSGT